MPHVEWSLVTPQELASALARILNELLAERGSEIVVTESDADPERPKNREHGDWASNLAMKFAKRIEHEPP